MRKLIINLAPTGMIPTKNMTPHVPISVDEIVNDVLKCAELGVSIAHIHAREPNGTPAYRKELFAEIISRIRKQNPELIIVASTSGRNFPEFQMRSEVLHLQGDTKPDMASLTLSSLNFTRSASVNSPDMIMKLAALMKEKGIKPELEIFDLGMVNYAKYLIKKDLINPPYYFNILLGNVASAQATLLHAGMMISELPPNSIYSLAGVGDAQKMMNALGVMTADGVRVGVEDNIWYDDQRQRLASNDELVGRIVKLAELLDRSICTPNETRKMLGIKK